MMEKLERMFDNVRGNLEMLFMIDCNRVTVPLILGEIAK